MDRETLPADPAALMARRRALKLERERLAQDRWIRFQAASRRRYGLRARHAVPLRVGRLLARAKWPGRVLLLAGSGVWHGWLGGSVGEIPGATASLVGYVRAGPDPAAQPRTLFDQASYLARNPGLAGSAWAPLAHYLVLGDREGRDPHPLFDVAAYRAQVAAPLGRLTALQHFLFRGASEALDPHPLFDLRFYVGQSEEVARSGENPLLHYLRKGWREGLDPHPLFAGAWYLARYPEAAAAGVAPLLHYVTAGAARGLDPHPLIDTAYWAAQSGRAAIADPVSDFLRIGGPARKAPTPHFNPGYYVQQLGGAPEVQANPFLHYVTTGSFEGAWPAGDFDEAAYFAAYPEAVDSGLSALDHWARHDTARPEVCASSSVLSSPEALAANLLAASTPDPFAYDWGAYQALSEDRRRVEDRDAEPGPTPAASRLDDARFTVVELSPGGLEGARAAVAGSSAEVVLLVEHGLVGSQGWADALQAAFATDVAAVAPAIVDASGGRSLGGRIAADGALEAARSGAGRDVEAAWRALAIRRSLLAEIGGLDGEALTAEGLLADLALRLQARGARLVSAPAAVLIESGAAAVWPVAKLARDRQRLFERWTSEIEALNRVRVVALRTCSPIDWPAVTGAQPNWRGHLQPRLPAERPPYDPADPGTLRRQADLAARYGVDGFCHEVADIETAAHTWSPQAPAFPFCLAWTGEDTPAAVIDGLAPGFAAPNALRADGRPLLLLRAAADASAWRTAARAAGAGDLYLVQRGGAAETDPRDHGFDARLQTSPASAATRIRQTGPSFNARFDGEIHDYRRVVSAAFATPSPAWPHVPLVQSGHDATPTSPNAPVVFHDASPGAFQAWLEWALARSRAQAAPGERLVFVDAWNDWMHGAALEPDRRLGHGWLEAVANALDAELLDR